MKETRVYRTTKPLSTLVPGLKRFIQEKLLLPEPEASFQEGSLILRSKLTGIIRHLSGLVFELTVQLTPTGDGFVAIADSGDIRKMIAALGIAWFLFWPVLISVGYGHLANRSLVGRVLDHLAELAAEEKRPVLVN